MKTILAAWIEQILEFPSKMEYMIFITDLKKKNQTFKEISYEQIESGIVKLRIRKQYNNNAFPDDDDDDEKKGGE
jgi:hypothetical protein